MFCPNCGKEMPAEAKFCPSCGKATVMSMSDVPPAPAAAPASAPPPPAYNPAPVAAAAPAASGGFMGWLRGLKTWKKVVLGIFLFIVLVVALAMWATSGLDEVVNRHFASIRAGDTLSAYSDLSIAARQQTSMEAFSAMLTATPALTHVTGTSWDSREIKNGQGNLEGMLEIEGGGKLPIEVRLVKENDQWKILAYHVKPIKTE
jgi:hypothetical protein